MKTSTISKDSPDYFTGLRTRSDAQRNLRDDCKPYQRDITNFSNSENRSRNANITLESSYVLPGGESMLVSTRKATHLNNVKATHKKVVDLSNKRVSL